MQLLVGILVVFAVFMVLFRWIIEPRLVYFPTRASEEFFEPAFPGGMAHDEYFETSDGLKLHAWWASPRGDMPTLLWFHGNAGNISHRIDLLALLASKGLGVFAMDYRGYGKSQGDPSEPGLCRDAEAAHKHVVDRLGVPPDKLFLFGQSLGGAVAIDLAVRQPCRGLIVESTFTSIRDMARLLFGPIPVHWFAASRYDSMSKIRSLKARLLVIHGEQDELIPLEQGRRLFDAAAEPKFFYPVPGAGHNDCYQVKQEEYLNQIVTFCVTH